MSPLNRRRFLLTTAAAAASLRTFAQITAAPAPTTATLTLHTETPGATVPANFIGLSYETQQLSDPTFFTARNAGLIAQFRALAPVGVLRIGGNTSDIGWWKPTPDTPQPVIHVRTSVGEPSADLAYSITPEAITNLRGFLDATGWTCIYGINLGTNTPARAADEAAFVSKTLGTRLEYFQLGNEPDLFSTHLRDRATWNADLYFDQWLEEADAIMMKVPNARFGLPDTSGSPIWYAKVVDRLLALFPTPPPCALAPPAACPGTGANRPRPTIAALSHHHYFGGPPSNPDINISNLLALGMNPKVSGKAHDIAAAAARLSAAWPHPVPYRMTEGNTCYRGGKPGVSDVFASALWAADYLLTLASFGYAGVNLHGGDGQMVANSLGGTLPGEALMSDPTVPHPRPFYTPIAHIGDSYVLEPVACGMKFAHAFAGATMLPVTFDPGTVNATAYAAKLPNHTCLVAIINKDASQDLRVDLNPHLPPNVGESSRFAPRQSLKAPSLESRVAKLTDGSSAGFLVPRSSATLFFRSNM